MIHTPSHTMSPPPSPKKMIPQSSHRMKVNSNMDMETDNEIITLSKSKYPELVNAAVGSTVRGNWEGIVKSIEGDTAQVELMTQEIESENGGYPADFTLREGFALGYVESWRGPVLFWIKLNSRGLIERCKITDPSFHNWQGLSFAVLGNIIPDFPLCNKSFDLTYSGNDL